MLAHPSVKVLGHRNDVPELMRKSDILVLPSIEEGFGLVIAEADGQRMRSARVRGLHRDLQPHEDGLMHRVGDVDSSDRNTSPCCMKIARLLREAPR